MRGSLDNIRFAGLLVAAAVLIHNARAAANGLVVEPTPREVRFRNGDAELVIGRDPWSLQLRGGATATVHTTEAEAPAFRIGEQWCALTRVGSVATTATNPARLVVELSNGAEATAEVSAFGRAGFRVLVRVEGADVAAVRGALALGMVEEVYGFGEMWNGRVAQRGQSFELWNRGGTPDECAYMPYYVSTANYAFFLNYGGRVRFDVGQRRADRLVFEAPAPELDMTFVAGSSIATTVENFLQVTGLPPLPPRWTFQPWFWLMADPDQPGGKIDTLKGEHSVAMVQRLRELNIPVGVTWFEPPWQDARSSFIPNPQFSADLRTLVQELSGLGVRTLAWTVPYTTPAAANWTEAVERGFLVQQPGAPGSAESGAVAISHTGELTGRTYNMIDLFNPAAATWWREQIERSLALGFRGFKLDAGQDLEGDARLYGGRRGWDVHNSYAREYNRVFFEALRARLGDDFLMVPRAAWVGSSGLTNFKWPGDLAGTFGNNGLPSSVYSSLSLAFCGLPFVSTDIGGFDDQPAPEHVWLRWAQFGALLPGMQTLHMPWWYSPAALEHFRFLAWLHTDLTPLWMTLAHEAAATGAPVVRPLVWTFQDDIDAWRVDDQFTVGSSLLVAPILNSGYERAVYFPEGVWYDFWDHAEIVRGPTRRNWFKGWFVNDRFPLYVREGAIIPLEVSNEISGFGWAESAGHVTLALWPKVRGASAFTLHDTEGPVRIAVNWRADEQLEVTWEATQQAHLLRMHLDPRFVPAVVTARSSGALPQYSSLESFRAGGEGWCFDAATKKLWVRKTNAGRADAIVVRLGGTP